MALLDLDLISKGLPQAWTSTVIGRVGESNIKVLRMDEMSSAAEVHDCTEGLLVISGRLMLSVGGQAVTVEEGQIFLAEAGVSHAVLPGSSGTLVIIDI
ncbi:cupin domain-containing protein [Pseudomonas vancouverensis]|uniref:Cupin domain-containing protein n=1 Tax=Pseudomonas vancouverensis TaxID=95300 RepID=A0A1H2MWE9_PSEVA|nr:cupin domain-containing protein [Pseudomonas vancouverensis]KAB0489628.1 cupin domain-containing protein [Pseudomonas vancouverensis]TDB69274.1 cupin domain-containing protein [Pseudomonas vancouverensis]SDU97623.1 Cupin domain-containing protein [Pseudomonas vancouverensis]